MPKRRKSKSKYYGSWMTVLLSVVIVFMIVVLWSAFISGPSRIYEEKQAERYAKIKNEVQGIKGLEENKFDYITYQGYTDETLYWFNEKCEIITTREIGTLDYDAAKKKAKDEYNMDCKSISLTFGYDSPCYELHSDEKILMLDYDTLEKIYERQIDK